MTNSNRVTHFEIQADDVERAKAFYKKVFGWKIDMMMDKSKGEMMDYWGITTGPNTNPGINGGMYERTKENILNTYDCTVSVIDIDKVIEMIKSSGGSILREKSKIPKVGWFATAVDTEGNMFGLMQETKVD